MTASASSPASDTGTGPRVTGFWTQRLSSWRVSHTNGGPVGNALGAAGPDDRTPSH